MCTPRWPITLLMLCLFGSGEEEKIFRGAIVITQTQFRNPVGSVDLQVGEKTCVEIHRGMYVSAFNDNDNSCCVTSSPISLYTPAPPLPSQISPPSPSILPSLLSPYINTTPQMPTFMSSSGHSEKVRCLLTMSPSTLVIRYGDPFTANCSVQMTDFSVLGWEVSLESPSATMDRFLVWRVNRTSTWSINAFCYTLFEQGGTCHINLPVTVYKPPDNVSISFVHTEPMVEGHEYTLQCTVQDVAPVRNLSVTFYRGQTALGTLRSKNTQDNKPVTEIFTLNIRPTKEDDGGEYWCKAELDLGPEGPQPPPVAMSQNITATVFFGPQLVCPPKMKVREGESLNCEVRGNPQPLVTWYRDGQVVALPTCSSRGHSGKYTILAKGLFEEKNFTVEVEVLAHSGTANSSRAFLLAVLLTQIINWL